MYGPEPTTSESGRILLSGKTSSSTIDVDEWVSTNWNVVSGRLRLNFTVLSSGVSMFFRLASSVEAPFGSAIFKLRSNEYFTSDDVSSSPLENFRPSRNVQTKVFGFVYSHDSA